MSNGMTFEKAASFLFAIKCDVYPDYWPFNMLQIVFFFQLRVTPLDIFRLTTSQIIHAMLSSERQIDN